jgi:hypothetical protein
MVGSQRERLEPELAGVVVALDVNVHGFLQSKL